jgi:hypothetical protein
MFLNIDTAMKIPLRLVCHVAVIEEPRYDYNISPENLFEKTFIFGRARRLKESVGMNIREDDCEDG